MANTRVVGTARSVNRSRVLACLALVSLIPCVGLAADPSPRVVWTGTDHVYVALTNGGSAAAGDSVRFEEKRKPIAGGIVAEVVRDEVAVVEVTSGSFARVKRLDRVRVAITRARTGRPPSLRLGLPQNRGCLLFSCPPAVPSSPHTPEWLRGYVPGGEASASPLRLLSDPHGGPPPPWPDTLVVSFFGNSTDEEIALERGDIDVGVFWPGELSRRMREDSRWKGSPLGRRSRGLVAIAGADLVPAGLDSASAYAFNEDLFRGDLEWTGFAVEKQPRTAMGLTAEELLPGGAIIEEWLARRLGRTRGTAGRLTYAEVPADSAAAPGFQPLFRLRCPIVTAPEWRATVEGMGPGVIADLATCVEPRPEARR